MKILEVSPWFLILGTAIIIIILIAIRHFFLKILEKIDFKRTYTEKYIYSKLREKTDDNGNFYYCIGYYIWQKNKLDILYEMFRVGDKIDDNFIITNIAEVTIFVENSNDNGKKISGREFRIYYQFWEAKKQVINNFTHNGIGDQTNTIYQNENNNEIVINQLENFLNDVDVESNDQIDIENFVNKLYQGKSTKEDGNKIIETLAKYTGIGSNIVSIISNIAKFFT